MSYSIVGVEVLIGLHMVVVGCHGNCNVLRLMEWYVEVGVGFGFGFDSSFFMKLHISRVTAPGAIACVVVLIFIHSSHVTSGTQHSLRRQGEERLEERGRERS